MELKKKHIIIIIAVGTSVVLLVVLLSFYLSPRTAKFRAEFRRKCEAFLNNSQRCEQVLNTFEETYVGREPCNFPEEAYHPFFEENPFTHSCDKTMFWSKTKGLEYRFCKKRNDYVCLQNTLLGNILDGLTWCGRKSCKETFICLCKTCKKNPVSSFWNKASAEFAKYACGNAHVLLNGETSKPFDPDSTFGAVEVKNLALSKVKSLTVILVSEKNNADCNHESLKDLQNLLNSKISYSCRTVTRSKILECIEKGTTTDACWT